jgi:8-oxo-dGTP pyrophosphatase MutT (NUDIX family)
MIFRERGQEVDIFYILRAMNPRDRWSGHVGLPGGGQQGNETDEETVTREVREEVGVCLQTDAKYLGRIDDRRVDHRTGKAFVVCCLVYLAMHDFSYKLDPKEVDACAWAPITYFTQEGAVQRFPFSPALPPVKSKIGEITGLTNINVTGVALPILDCQTPGQGPTNPESLTRPFMLWGLTWGMVNDIMTMSGVLPNRLDRPRFRYENIVYNAFLIGTEKALGANVPLIVLWKYQMGFMITTCILLAGVMLLVPFRSRL